ncbi:hypothetical protein [Microbacterium sp.]|uniref:hypothetical protein n=1 Tax=Microbacterium sp. TaxID=51671 RepID=UPI0039E4B08C
MSSFLGERGGRRRALIAVAAIASIVLVGAVFLWPRGAATSTEDVVTGEDLHEHHALPTVQASGAPLAVDMTTAEVVQPPAGASAGDLARTSLAEASSAAPETSRADSLGTPRAAIDPDEVLASGIAPGGCHASYGDDGQCLPVIPPSMAAHAAQMLQAGEDPLSMPHPWTCTEVVQLFPDGISVRAPDDDPDRLDGDGDGLACEPDDPASAVP